MNRFLSSVIALLIVLGGVTHAAAQATPEASPSASPVAFPTVQGCESVVKYQKSLNRTMGRSGAFAEYLDSGVDADKLKDDADPEKIVADGKKMLERMKTMEVPADYAVGHQGILDFYGYLVDEVAFYNIDSSQWLDTEAASNGLTEIYKGEIAIKKACPDEVKDAGGYIFYDPKELEPYVGE